MTHTGKTVRDGLQKEAGQASDVAAALTEVYNPTTLCVPPDPWIEPRESDPSETHALFHAYND